MKQLMLAPGACDAVRASARKMRIAGLGEDGCDESSMTALFDFAREKDQPGSISQKPGRRPETAGDSEIGGQVA